LQDPIANPATSAALPSIAAIETGARAIDIAWNDGSHDRFHYIWLRDNCGCQDCGDRDGGHRYLELSGIDPEIAPDEVTVDASGALCIAWHGDGHRTRFTPEWLRAHRYPGADNAVRRPPRKLWDAGLNDDFPLWDYAGVHEDANLRLRMFEQLSSHGFAILDRVPVENAEIERLASIFGFVRETHYGRVFELIATPQQRILAQTSHAIRPHNDELFRAPIPGLFMMHCLRASDCGGGASIFVDGFKVAARLRADEPEMFELLCRVRLPHRRFLVDDVDDVALAASWPAIETDAAGEVIAVHVNERTLAPLDCAAELVEPVYRAFGEFLRRLYDPTACLTCRLESGQAAVLDNHRVLHARTAFRGNRHIRQCHVDRDEFFSRLRALKRRFGAPLPYHDYV
jgi:gamma-butyrobetaine dioxygenase